MRILIAHNRYKTPGGEDAVVNAEGALLKDFGEDVVLYERDNAEFDAYSIFQKIKYFQGLGWSPQTYREIRALIRKFRPDVAHFHNIFYAISPSAYFACKDEGVPVVQSLHNFRLFCANGLFFRDDQVCEDCVTKSSWEGVYHKCYKNSRFLTALLTAMVSRHWKKGTWEQMVDIYITASVFGREKLIDAGIPGKKVTVKPNFVYPDPGYSPERREFALYVGRLREEKGVDVLLKAWESVPEVPLKIIGDGPMLERLKIFVDERRIRNVEFLGHVTQDRYAFYMRKAKFLIVPSRCYENFPRIVAEAFAFGAPVIASCLGSLREIIEDEKTGLLFAPGDPADLAEKIKWMESHENELSQMQTRTRQTYEEKYTAQKSYEFLIDIYKEISSAGSYVRQGA